MDDLSRCLLRRKEFSRRMSSEKLRVHELLSGFAHIVRVEDDHDEGERTAFEREAKKQPELMASVSGDKNSKRWNRHRNKEDEHQWMRQHNAFVIADINRIRKAALEQHAELQVTGTGSTVSSSSSSQSGYAPSSPASLVTLLPLSSRSVSLLPSRTRCRSRSPSAASEFDTAIRSVSKPQSKTSSQPHSSSYHTPPALAGLRHSRQLVRALCDDPTVAEHPFTYVVEAITGHRRAAHQHEPAADSVARRSSTFALLKKLTGWDVDRRDWRGGVQYEYEVKWLGFRQPTWEPQRGLGPFLATEYWKGEGTTLWSEDEVDSLRKKMEDVSRDKQQAISVR
jgi:hypothetical protein